MNPVNQEYLSMCKKLVEFYNQHIEWIRATDELEIKFMDLQMLIMKFETNRDKVISNLVPLMEEKREKTKELESIFIRFNRALDVYASRSSVKKHIPRPEIDQFPSFGNLTSSEILKHYEAIIHKTNNLHNIYANGITREDYHELETHITKFILSFPVHTLLEEKFENLHASWEQAFIEIDALINNKIDPEMTKASKKNPDLYTEYETARLIIQEKASKKKTAKKTS
jgi:hypothetical protein